MDDFAALTASGAEWERRLAAHRPERGAQPSVLPGWSVHELVNHVIGGAVRYLLLLRGAPLDVVEATREHDHVGVHPLRAHHRVAAPLTAEFHAPGALERSVRHRAGRFSGRELLRMRVLEQSLHAWDLARSSGDDGALPDGLVDYLLGTCEDLVLRLRAAGRYAGPVDGDRGGDRQRRLLALTGRDRHL